MRPASTSEATPRDTAMPTTNGEGDGDCFDGGRRRCSGRRPDELRPSENSLLMFSKGRPWSLMVEMGDGRRSQRGGGSYHRPRDHEVRMMVNRNNPANWGMACRRMQRLTIVTSRRRSWTAGKRQSRGTQRYRAQQPHGGTRRANQKHRHLSLEED